MTHFRSNGFSTETLHKQELEVGLSKLDGVLLYAIEEHEAIFEWIVEIRKSSSIYIWVCVPQQKVKMNSLLYLHLGADGIFETADLDELMLVMKRAIIRNRPIDSVETNRMIQFLPEKSSVSINKQEVSLTNLEYKLLSNLFEKSGEVQSYDRLFDKIWSTRNKSEGRAQLANLVASLRTKLRNYPNLIEIKTIRNKGYMLRV